MALRRFARIFNASANSSDIVLRQKNVHSKFLPCGLVRQQSSEVASFGLLFDIDGVLVRGKDVLPAALQACRKLTNGNGEFKVPVIFITNAGNKFRQEKAEQLSDWLNIKIVEEQVIMSHSPLKMFRQFHDKNILVSGQGPITEIAKNLGFTKITTIDDLRNRFPLLDMVDHQRRKIESPVPLSEFKPIEAVVLFGEPMRWETNLQLILDVLLTNGWPNTQPEAYPKKHIPVLACNMDLQWMAEAPMPRLAHGSFLICLETLYEKLTKRKLEYAALAGKPSLITYHHAEQIIDQIAHKMGFPTPLRRLYAIGDNPMTDIYGANLYDRDHLAKDRDQMAKSSALGNQAAAQSIAGTANGSGNYMTIPFAGDISREEFAFPCSEQMISVLVHTGVYSKPGQLVVPDPEEQGGNGHGHRDFSDDPHLAKPHLEVSNVEEAVQQIFELEKFT